MKKSLLLLALSPLALADPAITAVKINIHNNTEYAIELQSVDVTRIFAHMRFSDPVIPSFTSVEQAASFKSFDTHPMTVHIPIVVDGVSMKLMWQTNIGYLAPDNHKMHLCGVVDQDEKNSRQARCTMRHAGNETLILDYTF